MTDILYIIGNGSKHDNLEMRWSLRAVEKYAANVGRVFVSGSAPEWLTDDVTRIANDPVRMGGRNRSITMGIIDGVVKADLHGWFVLGVDDVFLREAVDFEAMPTYATRYHLPTENPTGGAWGESLVDTGEWLRRNGYSDVHFMTHAHIKMNADVIRRHYDEISTTALTSESVRGLEPLSLIGNMTIADRARGLVEGFAPVFRCDFKLTEFDLFGVGNMFSISDRIFEDRNFVSYMDAEFPRPSRWEAKDAD